MNLLDKILDHIGFDKSLNYLQNLIVFYIKPTKFFEKFFSCSLSEKIVQLLFYSVLVLGLGYVLINEITIKEIIKVLLFEFATLFFILIVLLPSDYIISKIAKRANNFENIIFFSILVKLLLAPFQLIFFSLFVYYENYNFFFLSNLVVLFLFFYFFFFSSKLFNVKIKYILLNIFLNLILLNLRVVIISELSIDNYSTFEPIYYTDQILKERLDKVRTLPEMYNVPIYRVVYQVKDKYKLGPFLFSTPIDSIASGTFELTKEYKKQILANISVLDTILPKLKFKRNVVFFKNTHALFKSIDSIINKKNISFSNKEIEKTTVYMTKDSVEAYKEMILPFSNRIQSKTNRLLLDEREIEQISYYSTIPLTLVEFLFPIVKLIY